MLEGLIVLYVLVIGGAAFLFMLLMGSVGRVRELEKTISDMERAVAADGNNIIVAFDYLSRTCGSDSDLFKRMLDQIRTEDDYIDRTTVPGRIGVNRRNRPVGTWFPLEQKKRSIEQISKPAQSRPRTRMVCGSGGCRTIPLSAVPPKVVQRKL